MGNNQEKSNSTQNSLSSSSTDSWVIGEKGKRSSSSTSTSGGYSGGQKPHYPNPPDPFNPDPATLREQWRFAIRQYSKWYSHAWGTAILAGVSFFALGWLIKGSNPLPSPHNNNNLDPPPPPSKSDDNE